MVNMVNAVNRRSQELIDISNRRVDQCGKLSEKSERRFDRRRSLIQVGCDLVHLLGFVEEINQDNAS